MKRGMERAIEIVELMRDIAREQADAAKASGRQLLFEVCARQALTYENAAKALRAERPKRGTG